MSDLKKWIEKQNEMMAKAQETMERIKRLNAEIRGALPNAGNKQIDQSTCIKRTLH